MLEKGATMDNDAVKMVTLEEAAAELGSTGLRLLMMIREGTLVASESDGAWQISREVLDRLKRSGIAPLDQKRCPASCPATGCGRH